MMIDGTFRIDTFNKMIVRKLLLNFWIFVSSDEYLGKDWISLRRTARSITIYRDHMQNHVYAMDQVDQQATLHNIQKVQFSFKQALADGDFYSVNTDL